MFKKIKEKILKKRFAVPLLAFLSLFILYPAKAAAAWFLPFVVAPIIMGITSVAAGYLAKGLTALSLIGGVLVFGWALSRAFMGLGLSFLNWGIGGTVFTQGMSMTNPANNAIIQIGWTLLRDLTNMFFILGLAYIGLATALNFANFNTKKTFTTLILVALLINFTPVICGVIVDASNIVMNFFLSEVNFDKLSDSYTGATKAMGEIQESALKDNIGGVIGEYLLMSAYGIVAGSVLMIFGFILLMRHFIIWILVILSPLAFFLRIFDFSKQWYTKWWGWFVSWSFVGIPAAFFLYLANHLLIQTKTGQVSGADITTNGLGAALSPYLITLVFMIIALITTLKIKAAGSGIIMNTANNLATKAKTVPGLIRGKMAPAEKALSAKAGAVAGVATAGGLAAIGAGYKKARGEKGAPGREGIISSIGAGLGNWAKQRGGLTKEGMAGGLKYQEDTKYKQRKRAERLGLAKLGTADKERRKELDTEALMKDLKEMSEDDRNVAVERINKNPAKTQEDIRNLMALMRIKAEEQEEIKPADIAAIQEFGWIDKKVGRDLSSARPDLAYELSDKKEFAKEVEKRLAISFPPGGPVPTAADKIAEQEKYKKEMTQKAVEKATPEKFSKMFQIDTLKGKTVNEVAEIAQHMNQAQVKAYGKKANSVDKASFRSLFFDPTTNAKTPYNYVLTDPIRTPSYATAAGKAKIDGFLHILQTDMNFI
ncbi:MAG: hypothetical protein Q7R99_04030 [bacterium]|nr:hypothetical protein [bacterium]